MGAVTEDKQVFALEGVPVVSPDLTQGKGVEQGLGGMRVPAVPGVDHAAVQAFGEELAAPLLEWRMTMTSGFLAWRVRAVSFMLSPFWRLEPDFASPKVSAERRLPAMSKEVLVRVLGSAKKRTTLFPLRMGTFLTGRELISCRFAAVSSRWKSSSCVNWSTSQQVFVRPMEGFLLHGGFSGVDVGALSSRQADSVSAENGKAQKKPRWNNGE